MIQNKRQGYEEVAIEGTKEKKWDEACWREFLLATDKMKMRIQEN